MQRLAVTDDKKMLMRAMEMVTKGMMAIVESLVVMKGMLVTVTLMVMKVIVVGHSWHDELSWVLGTRIPGSP